MKREFHYSVALLTAIALFSLGANSVSYAQSQERRNFFYRGDYLFDFDPAWGFSTEAQLFGRVAKDVGVGLSALLNLNREKGFPVIMLCVQVGKLWPQSE